MSYVKWYNFLPCQGKTSEPIITRTANYLPQMIHESILPISSRIAFVILFARLAPFILVGP